MPRPRHSALHSNPPLLPARHCPCSKGFAHGVAPGVPLRPPPFEASSLVRPVSERGGALNPPPLTYRQLCYDSPSQSLCVVLTLRVRLTPRGLSEASRGA